jgi:hypothetical protein
MTGAQFVVGAVACLLLVLALEAWVTLRAAR